MELDEVADELYAVPPEEFIAVRTECQDAAKADGDKTLAKEIAALPKPSAAAWACNLLVREQREEIESLVELGGLLRDAQENLAGDQLRALDVQRRQLIAALTRQARALADGAGHPISTTIATQVEETLRAAMADPEAGEALLSGRLHSPMSYSGMGTTVTRPALTLLRLPRPEPAEKQPAKAATTKRPGESAGDRRTREREERRRAAEETRQREVGRAREAAEAAVAAAEEAASAAEEARREVDELEARHADLRMRVDELTDQLSEAEHAATDAGATLEGAQRRLAAVQREADEVAEAADRAVAHADALLDGGAREE